MCVLVRLLSCLSVDITTLASEWLAPPDRCAGGGCVAHPEDLKSEGATPAPHATAP